jgi:outer membrane murein-binding lipoprotein Lpp
MNRLVALAILTPLLTVGCRGPNKANIELRKKNQDLQTKVDQLERNRQADQATIAALQKDKGVVVQQLPTTQVSQLFTVTGVDINKLTGFRKEGLKVYVVPNDAAGDVLKAAGTVTVEAYDLGRKDQPLLGRWEFPTEQAGANWYSSWVVSGYALTCPLDPPTQPTEITIRATFTDALTQRTFTAQRVVKTEAQAIAPDSR